MSVIIKKYGNPTKGSEDSVKKGNEDILKAITIEAKANAPVKSGALKNSIMWKTDKSSGGNLGGPEITENVDKGSGIVGSAKPYAVYVAMGTRNTAPNSFLSNAVNKVALGNGANIALKATQDAMAKQFKK